MTKLSDTQAILLSAAAQRADGNLLPLPGSLRGGAAAKVVGALLARGLAREEVTDRTTRADSALNTIWRNEDDGRAVLLQITPDGLAAIGVEPSRRIEPEAAPAGDAVDYRFNDGTNSAGEPAASAGGAGRGAEEARPAEEGGRDREPAATPAAAQDPRRHQAGAADRDAPPQGGRHHRPDRRGHRLAAAYGARRLRRGAEEEARPDRHLGQGRGSRAGLPNRGLIVEARAPTAVGVRNGHVDCRPATTVPPPPSG